MKRDYLNTTPYLINQPKEMYHFNSDTELLGRFMKVNKSDDVLDIGCNTGALLLFGAVHKPHSLTGVDLFEDVLDVTRENLEYNKVDAELVCSKIQDYHPSHKYSVIVCNPPYFNTNNKELISDNPYKAAARHESYLTLDELFKSVKELLKDNGTFYLVHRPDRLQDIILTSAKYNLYMHRLRIAYTTINGKSKSVLMSFTFNRQETMIEKPIYLDNKETFGD